MIDTIEYRGRDIPAPPVRPQDEPDYDATFIEEVSAECAVLAATTWHDRFEISRVLELWKSDRPAMWGRLTRAKIALKYARVLLAREAARQSRAEKDAARMGWGCSSSDMMLETNTDYWWRHSEEAEFDSALDEWRDRVSGQGFHPDDVLAFLRGEEPEYDDEE